MYQFWGKVRKHNQRGKDLGFPTANVNLHQQIPEGIYVSSTKIKGQTFQSATFIGVAKTFNETKYLSETYLLDFDKNIYEQWISVKLLKKIRSNQKFNSVKELVVRMKKDEQEARIYFKFDP